jgi:hypothetical protein
MQVTWLGEDTDEHPGPSYNTWGGIKFPKGVPVDVSDPHMIAKAKANQFFKVTEAPPVRYGDNVASPGAAKETVHAEGEKKESEDGSAALDPQKHDYPPHKSKKPAKKKSKKSKQPQPAAEAERTIPGEPVPD